VAQVGECGGDGGGVVVVVVVVVEGDRNGAKSAEMTRTTDGGRESQRKEYKRQARMRPQKAGILQRESSGRVRLLKHEVLSLSRGDQGVKKDCW
jgi:hypothetical protein